jgi:hypothetical protein
LKTKRYDSRDFSWIITIKLKFGLY